MSTLAFFHWLAETPIGIAMRDSTWAFAIVEIGHLLALAVFGGAILFLNLRLLGLLFVSRPAPLVARDFLPFTAGGVVAMFLSGALLVASGPMRYYYNTPFQIKMWLFFIAVFFHFTLQIGVARQDPQQDRSTPWRKAAGAFSILLWLSIGVAGRAVGYF